MRFYLPVFAVLCVFAPAGLVSGETKPARRAKPTKAPVVLPPETILFQAANGNVAYTHKKHYERAGGKCDTCHQSVFPQSREPLHYKTAQHRSAETNYVSCAHCHSVGRTAFAADSNCTKCHVKQIPKS